MNLYGGDRAKDKTKRALKNPPKVHDAGTLMGTGVHDISATIFFGGLKAAIWHKLGDKTFITYCSQHKHAQHPLRFALV
jgi:hypothetical protein